MIAGADLKNRYTVEDYPLDSGGMGQVFRAHDRDLDRPVVVKQLRKEFLAADMVERFKREARLTARMDHPGVPVVYDIGTHEGIPYLVLQPVKGTNLADLVEEQGALPVAWVAAIGAQISCVLLAAYRLGLVHRDIKPSNVMLGTNGAVKVLDFGLAVAYGDDRYSRITQSGQILGTPGYMAPEQLLAQRPTHRTDLYGLGALLFELITGAPPFDEDNPALLYDIQLNQPPEPPSRARPDLPAVLEDLVLSLLAKAPSDRPADAGEVYDTLAGLATELPPMPGVVDPDTDATQAYSSIIGRVSPAPIVGISRPTPPPDPTQTADRARRLLADGHTDSALQAFENALRGDVLQPADEITLRRQFADALDRAGQHRPAASQWRRLAMLAARKDGPDSGQEFEFRLRTARAHAALGERDRALTVLQRLLTDRVRVDGPGDAAVLALRHEITALTEAPETPSADH
ncbi:serine/threonine-protein kinase [Catellatospora sp. KI3]|uniref:serine/threonine-protein kinase n=1 Tax=Catellatospora sp. KI3 TaxID=3041620 RepID=UPI002482331A|nr:serine/threonine-protein kinase [Catellatospora sp. KI3]MDI1461088.1 serine/threonine-protein kinase [Catellatospora sp. KI3]